MLAIKPATTVSPCRKRPIRTVLAILVLLASVGFGAQDARAQSVEKSETSQQARQPENELQLAREAVTKSTQKPELPEVGRIFGDYILNTTFETGYRFTDTKGSLHQYLSDVNVRDGFRVFDWSMDMRSISGNSPLFDFLRADVSNAGGDQSQFFSIRADKTRAYKFDGTVRRFNYFRFQPEFVNDSHNFDLRMQVSDFNLKLFPQRAVRINLGYGRSMARGPFLTTYDLERDEFEIENQARWQTDDYRIGTDITFHGWNIFAEHLIRGFRDDTRRFLDSPQTGNPAAPAALNTFIREAPTRSTTHMTRLNLQGNIGSRAHLVLRGVYAQEDLDVVQIEQITGKNSSGVPIVSRRIIDTGRSRRPSVTTDALFTYDVDDHFSISNTFRFVNYRIIGDWKAVTQSTLQPATGAPQTTTVNSLDDRFTGLASFWNTFQVNYSSSPKFSVNVGWRTSYRDVTLQKLKKEPEKETQTTNTFIAGLRCRPVSRVNFFLNYEDGESNNAFVRINPIEYRQVRFRTNIQASDKLSFNVSLTTTDRTNPTREVKNDSDARIIAMSVFWQPNARVFVSGGYDYNHFFSTANIAFFKDNKLQQGRSIYYSRQNFAFADARFALTNRLDLLLAYRYTSDRGAPTIDPRSLGPNDFVSELPLRRHNPEFRLAYRFTNQITGNVSYRHFSYNENNALTQDYRANIVTTSIRVTF